MKKQHFPFTAFIPLFILLLCSHLIEAQNVTEDSSFNFTGIAGVDIDSTNDASYSSAIQSDGKIVSGGSTYLSTNNYTLSRLNPDGSVDTSFGDAGRVFSSFGMLKITGVAIQPDDKIVAGGTTGTINFCIARYLTDGTIDSTFDNDGYAFHSPNGIYVGDLEDLTVQPDGKILAVGTSLNGTVAAIYIIRLNTDGSLDSSFNGSGIVTYANFGVDTYGYAVALQPDGKILAGGKYYVNGTNTNFIILRLNANGTFDNTFNSAGVAIANLSDNDALIHIAVQSDGKIIATGESIDNALSHFISVARFREDGIRDSTFNGDGRKLLVGTNGEVSFPLPNGDLIVGGTSGYMPVLIKLKSDGTLDSTFGTNGYYTTVTPAQGDRINDGFMQLDGKIVLTGKITLNPDLSFDMAAVRYIINPNNFCSADFTLYPDTIPQNWIAVNQATGAQPLTYSWDWGDGSALSSGATPSHIYSSPGYYNICLTITDANGCTNSYCDSSTYINRSTSNSQMITVNVVLINAIQEQNTPNNTFFIFPNPSSGHFTISFAENVNKGEIEIFSLLGENVFSQKIDSNSKKKIQLNSNLHGIYFVKVAEGSNYYIKKIILN